MESYANQRHIVSKKGKIEFKGSRTVCADYWDEIADAMRALTPNEFKLWMYFVRHKEDYGFWFSTEDAIFETGISEDGCRKAFKALIDKGYLVGTRASNYYEFQPQSRLEKHEYYDTDRKKDYSFIDEGQFRHLLIKNGNYSLEEIEEAVGYWRNDEYAKGN